MNIQFHAKSVTFKLIPENQSERATLLFESYPDLKKASWTQQYKRQNLGTDGFSRKWIDLISFFKKTKERLTSPFQIKLQGENVNHIKRFQLL